MKSMKQSVNSAGAAPAPELSATLCRPDRADDPCFMTAIALADAYRRRTLSPVDVTGRLLERIEVVNPQLNAYYEIDRAGASAAARAAEARWRDGRPLGPLDGVPVSVKDHLQARGMTSPRGASGKAAPVDFDCPPVARLREGGAVILGKTTMPELSVVPVTESAAFGITRNPWRPDHSPGGSSGGGAAAVAAGLGPLALGTDGGGSIRLPAGFTNLVGLKPTLGRVPYYPGQTDRTVAGPLARTAADAALMMNVIARPDGRDWMELPPDGTDYVAALDGGGDGGLEGLRVAASPTFGFERVDPAVRSAFDRGVARLAGLGARIEPVEAIGFDVSDIYMVQAALRLRQARETMAPEAYARCPSAIRGVLDFAARVGPDDVQRMIDRRNELGSALLAVFAKYDVVVSPVSPTPAPPIGSFYPEADLLGAESRNLIGFACPFNLVHMPAISVPCGFTAVGLPVGLQIAAPKFADALLLRIAQRFGEAAA
jgi:aspartyl-tRNA(Asn)/glutamyl-tRNA(Gln) amidotransferase subunit A